MLLAADIWYAIGWLSFGIGHSWLAGPRGRDWCRRLFGRGWRLGYNVFAVVHLGVVLWWGREALAAAPFPDRPDVLAWLQLAMIVAGLAITLIALRDYDGGRFSGIAQLRNTAADSDEALHTDGLHRYVRHPLYLGLLLFLWGAVDSRFMLDTAILASVYLWIGTISEERKLVALYGDAYRDYRRRVPAILPWRGRAG